MGSRRVAMRSPVGALASRPKAAAQELAEPLLAQELAEPLLAQGLAEPLLAQGLAAARPATTSCSLQ